MTPRTWFEALREELPGDVGPIDRTERAALLELARVAAHTSERWVAPVSTYVAGLALASLSPDERVSAIRSVLDSLDAPPDGSEDPSA